MNWDRIRDNWKQVTRMARKQWHKLTDDNLDLVGSRFDQLVDRARERNGTAADVQRQVGARQRWPASRPAGDRTRGDRDSRHAGSKRVVGRYGGGI